MHDEEALPMRVAEQRALEVTLRLLQDVPPQQVLATTLGRGQAAKNLAVKWPHATVRLWFLDHYRFSLCQADMNGLAADANVVATFTVGNLQGICAADVPQGEYDLAVLPSSRSGEAELFRDQLQAAYEQLAIGGLLVTSVDHEHDRWLHEQMQELDKKIRVDRFDDAAVYSMRKSRPLKRVRSFTSEIVFRDGERLLKAISRPGVFSHRRVDVGARQLLNHAPELAGGHVLEIGCGSGVVSLAMAARDPATAVFAVDSSARSVECLRGSAKLNDLHNLEVKLASDGLYGEPETFDVAFANPPYYAHFRIAELFVLAAHRALKRGGVLYLVTKNPNWYDQQMPGTWAEIQIVPSKLYHVVVAKKA